MYRFIFISAALWFIYGISFLALAASIISLPEKFEGGKNILYIYAFSCITCGVIIFITGYRIKLNKKLRFCYQSLRRLLIGKNFKLTVFEFAKACSLGQRQSQYFLNQAAKRFSNKLYINEKGIIRFDVYIKNKIK